MDEIQHYIGGKRVPGKSGRTADVFNPATGEVQAHVPLASGDELNAAIENAKAAQPHLASQNPQKRARVMMEFVRLLHRDMDKLAEALSREHGKTIPDAKGDVIRGLEVAEYCIGAPQMLKGEFSEGAGPGIEHAACTRAPIRGRLEKAPPVDPKRGRISPRPAAPGLSCGAAEARPRDLPRTVPTRPLANRSDRRRIDASRAPGDR